MPVFSSVAPLLLSAHAVKFQQARKAAWLLFRNWQETTPTKL